MINKGVFMPEDINLFPIRVVQSPPSHAPSPAKEKLLTPQQLQAKLAEIMHSPADFPTKSAQVVALLEKHCPEKMEALNQILARRAASNAPGGSATMLSILKDLHGWKGWKTGMKAELAQNCFSATITQGLREQTSEMERFRAEAVNGVIQVCLAAVKGMGYDPAGEHSATGTPGWESDIDSVYNGGAIPHEVQNMEKILFDMIVYQKCGDHPGVVFDTETYIEQAGFAFKTGSHLQTAAAQAAFARGELAGASLQMLRQCGGAESRDWQVFKEQQIEAAGKNTPLRNALIDAFHDVEHLEKDVEKAVIDNWRQERGLTEEQAKEPMTPEEKKLAAMSYKCTELQRIGKKMDLILAEIDRLEGQAAKGVRGAAEKPGEPTALENLHLQLAMLAQLRDTFFDEGYNTQGTFRTICLNVQGQRHEREVEGFRKGLQRAQKEGVDINIALQQHRAQLSSASPEKREQPPNVQSLSVKPFSRRAEQKVRTTPQEHASSALENLAMYQGHYQHLANRADRHSYQTAFLETSKYSERSLASSMSLLSADRFQQVEKSLSSEIVKLETSIQALEKQKAEEETGSGKVVLQARIDNQQRLLKGKREELQEIAQVKQSAGNLYAVACDLERAKRGSLLGTMKASEALFNALSGKDQSEAARHKLEQDIAFLMRESDRGGKLFETRLEETLLPEDRYQYLLSKWAGLGHCTISTAPNGTLTSGNPRIDAILKARAGLDRESPEVKELLEAAKMDMMGALTWDGIANINEQIAKTTTDVYHLSVKHGVISCPKGGDGPAVSVRHLWQQLHQESRGDVSGVNV